MINGYPITTWAKAAMPVPFYDKTDKILVLIQLDGGNDGLNTLIPIDQYDTLQMHRSNILIPENKILNLSEDKGFHPSMTGMHKLYQEGTLKLIQNVGYPSPNRSHFRSTDIWTSGSPSDEVWTTGWIGRYFDSLYPGFPEDYPNGSFPDPFAITIATRVSETCQGIYANYSMAITDPTNLSSLAEGNSDIAPATPYGFELTFLRNAIAQTNAYGEVVLEAAEKGNNLSPLYDENNDLAMQLKTVAKLISGGLRTSIYVVRVGGYDTHANQTVANDPTIGEHAGLLLELSDAIHAFQDDLHRLDLDKRVLGLTFTEFGRQIKSNESYGTDHGEAGPMFLFGSCVDPTDLGNNPIIPVELERQEALGYDIDFRNVFGSLLMDWFAIPEESVRELLWPDFIKLDLLDNCSTTSVSHPSKRDFSFFAQPNPTNQTVEIHFYSTGEAIKLDLFNNLGQFQQKFLEGTYPAGPHSARFNLEHLKPGIFYCRLTQGNSSETIRLVRQ
jgi:uncharacterized protein (DUF1501 family)